MNESNQYNESDLGPFRKRLTALRNIVQLDSEQGKNPNAVTKLLLRQITECGMLQLDSLTVPPNTTFR